MDRVNYKSMSDLDLKKEIIFLAILGRKRGENDTAENKRMR